MGPFSLYDLSEVLCFALASSSQFITIRFYRCETLHKSLNKMACCDSGKNSRHVTNVGKFHLKVLAVRKSLNKSIMMELG